MILFKPHTNGADFRLMVCLTNADGRIAIGVEWQRCRAVLPVSGGVVDVTVELEIDGNSSYSTQAMNPHGPVTLRRAKFLVPAGKVYFTLPGIVMMSTWFAPAPKAAGVQTPVSVAEVSTQKSVP